MNKKIGIVLISAAGLLTIGALVVGMFFNCSENNLRADSVSYRMGYGMHGSRDYDDATYGVGYGMHRYRDEKYDSTFYGMHEDYGNCHEEYDIDDNNYRRMR